MNPASFSLAAHCALLQRARWYLNQAEGQCDGIRLHRGSNQVSCAFLTCLISVVQRESFGFHDLADDVVAVSGLPAEKSLDDIEVNVAEFEIGSELGHGEFGVCLN